MSTILKLLTAALTFFTACDVSAQGWEKLENLPETEFSVITALDGTLYTASTNKLYTSNDMGDSWDESEFTGDGEVIIICLARFGDKIYAGTTDGVYSAPADAVHDGEWNHDIFTLPVTSFAEKDGTLYASVYGFGAMVLNGTAWMNFSTGLPNTSQNVAKLVATSEALFALAGGNGTFYKYDFTAGNWEEHFYTGDIEAGVTMDDGLAVGATLYACNGSTILRSDDDGETWTEDREGAPSSTGLHRFIYKGQQSIYSIMLGGANTPLNKRAIDAAQGVSWAENAETLPWATNSLCEGGNKLLAAATDGVYVTENVMAVGPGVKFENTFIYPNPCEDGLFRLQTPLTIDTMNIFDMTGRLIYSAEGLTGLREFVLSQEGVYVVVLSSGDATATQKLIVKK